MSENNERTRVHDSQSPIVHDPITCQAPSPGNLTSRKPVESARQSVTARRCHEVPSTLQSWEPGEIVGSLRAGRSVEQTRKAYNCTASVALELWLRSIEKRLAGLARPMVALSWLLMGASVGDVWQGNAVPVERAFRGGRARKRGLEDGTALIDLRQLPVAGAA
jgi:hypothetical protein